MDVRTFTVGPLAENCYFVRRSGSERTVVVDPGDEADRLLAAIAELGLTVEAILLTHTHFDHVGAVAPLARATGAPVVCPLVEAPILADVMTYVPPGLGKIEPWQAERTVEGGETLELAGLELEVVSTPGHSPGHVTYAIAGDDGCWLFSGDVLFAGSVGRTDLPGGEWLLLARSIQRLLDTYPDEAIVHPGHMGLTTLGRERTTNPFLAELAL